MLGEQSSETHYFFGLTPEHILTSVEEFGVRCTGRVTQLNSMENRVYEVEIEVENEELPRTARERFRIAKFYRPGRWSREQILEEHQFLLDLTEVEIPALAPLKNGEGSTLFTRNDLGMHIALFPKMRGRSPDELNFESSERLGRLVARMHAVGKKRPALHRIELTPEVYGIQNLRYLIDAKLLPQELIQSYSLLVEQICVLSSPLFKRMQTQRIHGDLHFGNIIWPSTGPHLVDFDDMVRGPAVQDLWLVVPGRDEEARRIQEHLLAGYEQITHFDRSSLHAIESLRALRFIHFSAWIGRRWHDPSFQRAFPHFGTPGYWNEQLSDLREQLSLIQEGTVYTI